MTGLPDLYLVRQDLHGPVVADPAARTAEALASLDLATQVTPGQTVAIAVGSRGIANLAEVVRATVEYLRNLGLEPFVVPAMGSHGGATAEGQAGVLAGYGITEPGVGAPVRAQMDVVELCRAELGFPVYLDRLAAAADHVVVVNRVKPHTMFEGKVQSGLTKMLLIGLGKQAGASVYHRAVFDHEWSTIVDAVAPEVLGRVSVLAGLALVENAADQTARIEAVAADEFLTVEPELLTLAASLVPKVPFDDVDILLIDQIGKDISGSGFDTNAVGRKPAFHEVTPDVTPRVRTIIVRGLTPGTHGNALGVGLAELCRARVVDAMDREATWINAVTSGDIPAGMLPLHRDTDLELLQACSSRSGLRDLTTSRLCWIRNTLDLGVVGCSGALLDDARARGLEIVDGPIPLPLDDAGNLPDLLPRPGRVDRSAGAHR